MANRDAMVFILFVLAVPTCTAGVSQDSQEVNPVRKVVTLLGGMKAQVEKEAKEDEQANGDYVCWCSTNKQEKDAAVEAAQKRIAELESFIEEAAGLEAQLKTEIDTLVSDVASDQDSLQTATALKEKETAEFQAEEADMKECIAALKEALTVLKKVQLVQQGGHPSELKPLLLQVQNAMKAAVELAPVFGGFRGIMQRDLWDVMSSINDEAHGKLKFLPRTHQLSTLEQHGKLIAEDVQPNSLVGDAAGSKSYNARSGNIVGVLSQMQEEFEANLVAAQKQELSAKIAYQQLKSQKTAQIAVATAQKKSKESLLADTLLKASQAKDEMVATKDALSADQQFLLEMTRDCKTTAGEYDARVKVRNDELQALAEAIKILTEDEARDLFGKTLSFIQTSSVGSSSRNAAVTQAMRLIMHTARQHKNWALAALAVRVRLDAFTKVKEMMDKMLADLKQQQKDEDAKLSFCQKEIDQTEDDIKTKNMEKEDLETKQLGLTNTIETLKADITTLQEEVAEMKMSLKKAGEDRKAENQLFQQSIGDQRATIQILKKALARLEAFYKTKSLVQVGFQGHQEPGAPNAPPPPTKTYEKSPVLVVSCK